jgi:uncharacterized membrane protein YhfC
MDILILTYPLSAVLIFVMAIGLGYYLTRRFKLNWRLYWIGAAVFVFSQVLHIPFNNYALPALVNAGLLPTPEPPWQLPFQGLVLGLSAGIFEETGRWLMYRFLARDARSWSKGLLAGAGHGGIEALIIGGLILYTYLQVMALRGADLSQVFPPEQVELAEQQIAAFWGATWYESMMGALERVLTIPVHLALSLLVMHSFLRRQLRWLFMAIGWHTLVNGVAAVYVYGTWGSIYATELALSVFTLLSIAIIFALRRRQPEQEPEVQAEPKSLDPYVIPPVEENADQVEDSRYQRSD